MTAPSVLKVFEPERGVQFLGVMWQLKSGVLVYQCGLATNPEGWKLGLVLRPDDFMKDQVCRTQEEVFETAQRWKSELEAKGFKPC